MDIFETESSKDYVLVNEEETPIIIRLWQNILEDYVTQVNMEEGSPTPIIATNVEVNTFHGLSLASRSRTYILHNPPCVLANNLNTWYENNKAMWTAECSNCNKPTGASIKLQETCVGCNKNCHVDPSSPNAEKLIPFTASQIADCDIEEIPIHHEIAESLKNKSIVCFIKYYDKYYIEERTRRYPVLKLYTPEEPEVINHPRSEERENTPPPSPLKVKATIEEPKKNTIEGTSATPECTEKGQQSMQEAGESHTNTKRSLTFPETDRAVEPNAPGETTRPLLHQVKNESFKKAKTDGQTKE